jgi:pentapeptide MXKDX repeat protein
MKKLITAALAGALALGVSSAFAQEASGAMSNTEMASGTMAKEPMQQGGKMKSKKKHAMGKHAASDAPMQHEEGKEGH